MSPPLLLGHRGDRCAAAENTFAAFDLALGNGCDGFEFDVRATGANECVVCHDARYAGMEVEGASLLSLRAHGQFPLLAEIIDRYGVTAFLDIELKAAGIEEQVLAMLAGRGLHGFLVSSFLPNVIRTIQSLNCNTPTGLIFDGRRCGADWRELDVGYVVAEKSLVTRQLITEAHERGRRVMAWTVNREREMLRLRDWGVDGIISDNTALLCRTLRPG
ncbi:MAG: glycerophosphodiester phosphodiesterase [Acidobacteria bacterium]|nr:glycerophosphodiester phosphodiesterase [Acidobacteriota bacterium]